MSETWPDGFAARIDAEHRAEIDRLKGELAEANKRADALESLIDTERQVRKETENTLFFVRKELAAIRSQLRHEVEVSNPHVTAAGETCECDSCSLLAAAVRRSSAPSCTASAGSCNSPKACGEAGRCIDARMREVVAPAESTPVRRDGPPIICDTPGCGGEIPVGGEGDPEICPACLARMAAEPVQPAPPDDIRERLGEALDNIERMKVRYSEQSRQLVAIEQERNDWRQQRVDIGIKLDLFAASHKGQGCGRRVGDAALEAKGEPGTQRHYFSNDGKKRCEACGLPEDRPVHMKGAKP